MKKQIQNWSNMNLTQLGRITVSKSLIISKITYILVALSTPSKETAENLFINVIWKNKRHEVSKAIIYRSIEESGLNMIDIKGFEVSLKMTRLHKIIIESPDWSEFAYTYKINRVFKTNVD